MFSLKNKFHTGFYTGNSIQDAQLPYEKKFLQEDIFVTRESEKNEEIHNV